MIVKVQYTITGEYEVDSENIDSDMSFEDVEEAIKDNPWEGDECNPLKDGNTTITVTKLSD